MRWDWPTGTLSWTGHFFCSRLGTNSRVIEIALWKTRERISVHTGFSIPGVAELNIRLSRLSPSAPVEQYNFDSETSSGSIFVDAVTGELLGDTIVERSTESRQIPDIEPGFLEATRKTA